MAPGRRLWLVGSTVDEVWKKGLDDAPIFLSMSSGLRARADRARAPRYRVRRRPDAHSVARASAVIGARA